MTTYSPIVSIVMTAYNCEACIGECLTSLQGQGLRDFETSIVDDDSRNGTADVVCGFVRRAMPLVSFRRGRRLR